jgi:serine/threonine-protein kinase
LARDRASRQTAIAAAVNQFLANDLLGRGDPFPHFMHELRDKWASLPPETQASIDQHPAVKAVASRAGHASLGRLLPLEGAHDAFATTLAPAALADLAARVVRCRRCPRLVAWREETARTKRRAYRDETYWGRPVPGFGVEAAAAAVAMTEALPYAGAAGAGATQAMPLATELSPYGPSTMSDATALGLPPGSPAEQEQKPNRAAAYVLLTLAALAAVVVLLFVFGPKLFSSDNGPTQVSVPPVTNMAEAQAQAALTRLGLKAVVNEAPNDTVAKGLVADQDPSAGSKVDPGSTVTLTVSAGPNKVRVPDLTGLSKDDAKAALEQLGLKLSTTDTVESAAQDAGKVIDTDPAGGTTVDKGSAVALHLASGKATVPNVVGMDNLSAAQKLTAAGFKVKQTLAPSDQPANQVIAQDHAGDVLKRGQTVTLTVSNGSPPPPTDTPSGTPTA